MTRLLRLLVTTVLAAALSLGSLRLAASRPGPEIVPPPGRTPAPSGAGPLSRPALSPSPLVAGAERVPSAPRAWGEGRRSVPDIIRATPRPVRTVAARLTGKASWYCLPGRSACTHGYAASGAYAAAGPRLRAALGDWRGRTVTVDGVRVRLIDWCGCPDGRLLDLYGSVFRQLAPLSRGVVSVEVAW